MSRLLMPRSTALWLLNNTKLTLQQISSFCSMSILDLDVMKRGFSDSALQESDPVSRGQLLLEEIELCEENPSRKLSLNVVVEVKSEIRKIPYKLKKQLSKFISWMHRNYPDLTNKEIAKFFGVTQKTVEDVVDNPNSFFEASDPILNGVCSKEHLNAFIEKVEQNREKAAKKSKK
ncbi:DUF1013 domain-containing protein [Candidatus Cytomitobacter indipagum]|uniref:DUF1013 domain-containing protein n=1 Tax=Candidatus Cytomitobacter indipagum TaxID=2601575 RepID=A0A5C0UD78_9PROT|nr:cell cycle transcriptional regulator TrcR [Candidatus Cytomitobacter indipagum]QEK37985.1 DUF1013 domain-containing protein [Candidatus Cytomitobacter indipagum]